MNTYFYESAFNESVDAIIITDGLTGKIIDVNNSCASLLGYDKSELIGNNIYTFLLHEHSNESPEQISMVDNVLTNKKVKTKIGEMIPVDMIINTVDAQPGHFVMTSLRDVRERIQYEDEILRMNKQLLENNATKDKLFSIIAHDLKNPMMAISGLSEIIVEDHEHTTIDEYREFADTIYSISKETSVLLSNLLNWAMVQTNRIEMCREEFDLHSAVSKVFDTCKASADLKKIELVNSANYGSKINADTNMITTVIRNLISNSIKFSSPGSHITVITLENTNEHIIIVQDEGVGMEESYVQNLFKTNVKTSREGTNNEKGTGLGLLLCNEFVKLHNGDIKVKSELDKGSQFIITLPK